MFCYFWRELPFFFISFYCPSTPLYSLWSLYRLHHSQLPMWCMHLSSCENGRFFRNYLGYISFLIFHADSPFLTILIPRGSNAARLTSMRKGRKFGGICYKARRRERSSPDSLAFWAAQTIEPTTGWTINAGMGKNSCRHENSFQAVCTSYRCILIHAGSGFRRLSNPKLATSYWHHWTNVSTVNEICAFWFGNNYTCYKA